MPEFPIEISFRSMDHSDAVEADIREKIDELERFYDRILKTYYSTIQKR